LLPYKQREGVFMAKTKLLGTLALLLALVVGIVACDDGSTTSGGGGGPKETEITGLTIASAFAKIGEEEGRNSPYLIKLDPTKDNSIIGSANLAAEFGKEGVQVRLISASSTEAVVNLASAGTQVAGTDITSLFTLTSATTLIIDKDVTLQGYEDTNTTPESDTKNALVVVSDASKFEMRDGSKITGAVNATGVSGTGTPGGAVLVDKNGSFTMKGGEISANTALAGAGVYVRGTNANFTMTGGTIKDNVIFTSGTGGAGVFIAATGADDVDTTFAKAPTFTMEGGIIKGIEAGTPTVGNGGGVYVLGNAAGKAAVFKMTDGEISANNLTAQALGGGVDGGAFGVFTLDGAAAVIKGNTIASDATSKGGGVYVAGDGVFTLKNGLIGGNDVGAAGLGGGVAVVAGATSPAQFIMEGGTIGSAGAVTGNISIKGGGVYLLGNTVSTGEVSFAMTGGEIVGNNVVKASTAIAQQGGGVYVGSLSSFTMGTASQAAAEGPKITGNSAVAGGGVAVYAAVNGSVGVFTMLSGELALNEARGDAVSVGGGVYINGATGGGTAKVFDKKATYAVIYGTGDPKANKAGQSGAVTEHGSIAYYNFVGTGFVDSDANEFYIDANTHKDEAEDILANKSAMNGAWTATT
jgi:hypothetical protein